MDFLKQEIQSKKRQLEQLASPSPSDPSTSTTSSSEPPLKKYLKRSELEALRSQGEKEKELEKERIRKQKLYGTKSTTTSSSEVTAAVIVQEEVGETFNVSNEEAIRRLRRIGQPIKLFGESDKERRLRLRALELIEERTEGQRNDFARAMEGQELGIIENNKKDDKKSSSDSKNRKLKTNTTTQSQSDDKDKDGQDQVREPKPKDEEVLVNLDLVKTNPHKVYPQIYHALKRVLKEWEQSLAERPESVKRSTQGKVAAATQATSAEYLKPLFKQLRKRDLADDVLLAIAEITFYMQTREYLRANDAYLRLSIGNAPWPIGVTMVGIHERSGREKIFSSNVAHALNDETSRKYIQSLKRLLTFAQAIRPPADVSQNANLLISNFDSVLPILSLKTLELIQPFLPLSILIKLKLESVEKLNEIIDWQKDWLLLSPGLGGCPFNLRNRYLIDLFPQQEKEKEELSKMMKIFENIPEGIEYLIKVEQPQSNTIKKLEFDWNNVVLGGGAVLACLKNEHDSKEFEHSDFDLFLYGLDHDQLIPKVSQIIQQISSALPSSSSSKLLILKGFNATTLLPPLSSSHSHPRRAIQIVLQSNSTVYDSIAGFDLDVCAICFDGEKFKAVPGAIRALSSNLNYFDPKYARNFDTTASIVSSRTIKYKSRGFSLALPISASRYLSSKPRDTIDLFTLSTRIQSIKNQFKDDDKGGGGISRNESLFGLKLLLRKEYNKENKKEVADVHKSDYGPIANALGKGITKKELKESENWEILENFNKFGNKVNHLTREYLKIDNNLVVVEGNQVRGSLDLATESLPYVPGFDHELMFGISENQRNGERATKTNLQYIAAVPKSLLPFIEQAEKEINKVLKDSSSQNKNYSATPRSDHFFSPQEAQLLRQTLEKVELLNLDVEMSNDSKPTLSSSSSQSSSKLKRFIPTFSPPYPSSSPTTPSIKLTHPLLSTYIDPVSSEKLYQAFPSSSSSSSSTLTTLSESYVYLSFSLSSLLQFRGISTLVDQVKDLLFLSYIALTRLTNNYPYEGKCLLKFPDGNEFEYDNQSPDSDLLSVKLGMKLDEYTRLQDYLKSRSTENLVKDKFRDELEWIREMGETWMRKSCITTTEKGMKYKLGEWDLDRQSWLNSYLNGQAMI
ncbi:hypothetical protein JCM3765_006176 [Sporobolomyces pararoseus]